MADPLSIASGALAVITAAQATGAAIYKFIRNCKEARTDLALVSRELSELILILQLIRDDSVAAMKGCLPDALQTQVQSMLASCTTTIQQIERIVAKCCEKTGPLRWTISEKEKVATLKVTLEAFKSGLSLVLETINLSLTREIKNNTEAIQDSTAEIKRDTDEILRQIYKLRSHLPSSCPPDQERFRLEQWLDSLTHYAETIVADEAPDDVSDTSDLPSHAGEQEQNDEIVPLDKFKEQEVLGDETANKPLAPPSLDTSPIKTGESGSSENRDITSGRGGYQLSKRLDRPKNGPLDTDKSAAEIHNPSERGSNPIPYKIVASVPCSSPAVSARHSVEAGVWAVLHEDSVLRFWSSHSGELIQSLKVLRKDYRDPDANVEMPDGRFTTIEFCPVNPELIFIQAQNRKIEVWNWRECLRITIAKKARKVFTTCPVSFAPQSTLMYAIDDHGTVTMADLSIPLEPLAPFTLQRDGSTFLCALFLSNTEIWTLHTRKERVAGRIARIIPLPSLSEVINYQQAPIVATRCESFPLRYGFPYQFGNAIPVVDYKRRRLITLASHISTIHVLSLETGEELFGLNLNMGAGLAGRDAALNSVKFSTSFRYFFHRGPWGVRVVSMEDGRNLGRLSPKGWPDSLELYASTKSEKAVFYRYNEANSSMEFGITDVSLDELAEETTK